MEPNPLTQLFTKGERVRYIPTHAQGDDDHPDVEDGVVSSTNEYWVFVKYDNLDYGKMTTGDEPYTAKATDPHDLVKIPKGWD